MVLLIEDRVQTHGIALGNVTVSESDRPDEWNVIISDDMNYEKMKLRVDGKEITFDRQKMYMSYDMNVMIPAYVFNDVFKCAFNTYTEDNIVLQKGSSVASLHADSDYVSVGEQQVYVPQAYVNKDGIAYINSLVLENILGYSSNWDSKENVLVLVDNKASESILPSSYNYRNVGRINPIKNQGKMSTCWAFAAISAVETSIMPKEDYRLSVDNMVNNNGYAVTMNDGGDYTRSIAYLTSWKGPVLDSDDEYGDGICNTEAKPVKHVQEVQLIESKNLEAIKKAVFLYGGVESSLYTSMSDTDATSIYYNNATNSYCYIGTLRPNHDIVIVGWDDNYSKDNFSAGLEGDGAFICMNSWGSDFGDDGLFYVSYYDSNIGIHNVVYTGIEDTDNYDNIYQSDICGWVGQLGYEEDNAYFSNVYEAKGDEMLEATGFYATGKNTSYEIYVVEDFIDESSFDNMVFQQSGVFGNAGYYTVNLKNPVQMQAGKKYAVVVKIKTPDSVHPIAIEYCAGRATRKVILSDGEGYISLTGKSWEHVEESKSCNICLKMYTSNVGDN